MTQCQNESSDDFLTRLTNQAILCKFADRDARIIEQINYDTKYAEVQKELLVKGETYTLAEAIEACRICDASVGHQQAFKDIQGGTDASCRYITWLQILWKMFQLWGNTTQISPRLPCQGCHLQNVQWERPLGQIQGLSWKIYAR